MDRAIVETPRGLEEVQNRQLLPRWTFRQGSQDPLRPAGRAGRIEHRGAKPFVRDRRIGKSLHRLVETEHLAAVTGTVDYETAFDARALRHGLQRDVALGRRGHQNPRLAVV